LRIRTGAEPWRTPPAPDIDLFTFADKWSTHVALTVFVLSVDALDLAVSHE
jgi:hypothetical protein